MADNMTGMSTMQGKAPRALQMELNRTRKGWRKAPEPKPERISNRKVRLRPYAANGRGAITSQ